MNAALCEQIAAHLNALPFVRWDRFTENGDEIHVFGWIDRPDGRAELVRLDILLSGSKKWAYLPGYSTSSAERSEEIGRLLGHESGDHIPCQRVDVVFGELVDLTTTLTQ